jgi:thiamine-phosphate pyrophosphorylase
MQQSFDKKINGIYAITPNEAVNFNLVEKVIIKYKVGIFQYRHKTNDEKIKYKEAKYLRKLCSTHNTLFIINDDINLAEKVSADGVHLGKNDGSISKAREVLGKKAIIGVSCYNDIKLAIESQHNGANYIAFGALFDSTTKPNAQRCQLEIVTKAKKSLSIPIVGIGGVNFNNIQIAYKAGCSSVAMINALFDKR